MSAEIPRRVQLDDLPCAEYGLHTLEKLAAIHEYLTGFDVACKSVRHLGGWTFVDTFAGPGYVRERASGRCFLGSTLTALEVGAGLAIAVDIDAERIEALRTRAAALRLADRLVTHVADSNVVTTSVLDDAAVKAPTFILHDPERLDLDWLTVREFGAFGVAARDRKPEQLINFNDGVGRLFYDWGETAQSRAIETRLDSFFGSDARADWRSIIDKKLSGRVDGRGAVRLAVELYERRLRQALGYSYVESKEIRRGAVTRGPLAYHLIHATDHDAGDRIRRSVFGRVRWGEPRFPGL